MMKWKGIVLAGGNGTRLYPITRSISKQLLPIYDKPMIYYPLSVLMLSGIQDILIITTPDTQSCFQRLLGSGENFGVRLQYVAQQQPGGLAQAFLIGEQFIGADHVCLVLGDNIFYGQGFVEKLGTASRRCQGATVFGYPVKDPEQFGVVEFDASQSKVVSIEEKPTVPKSSFAITGLYFYDNSVVEFAHCLQPSQRGELEITDINRSYLDRDALHVELLGRGFAWLDTGTHDSLIEAGQYIKTIENRQRFKVACLEEIAYRNGWINKQQLREQGERLVATGYGRYLLDIADMQDF